MKKQELAAPKNIPGGTAKDTEVEVKIPARISIELVQGNELRHYEIFFSLFSISASTATGFLTALASSPENGALRASSIALTIFALIFLGAVVYYNFKLRGKSIKRTTFLDSFKKGE